MAANKNQSKNDATSATVTEEAPAVVTEVNAPAAPEGLAGEVVNEVAAPPAAVVESPAVAESPAAPPAAALRVFSVEIPLCLLGVRTFIAESADDAYQQYRKLGGINSHARQQIVNELPEGSPGYVEAIAAAAGS